MTKQEEINAKQRERRHKNRNASDRKYHHTIKGYLVRSYRNMKSRISGINKKFAYLYIGKPLLPKEDFYTWALANPDYHRLFEAYVASGFNAELAPSVDRIDPNDGYVLGNMRYLTLQENRKLGLANGRAVMAKQREEEVPCPF